MEVDYKELIIKFFAEEISDNELDLLKSWLSKSSENRRIFDQENELWNESSSQVKIDYYNADLGWNSISSKYSFGSKTRGGVAVIKRYKIRWLVAAAVLALLILSGSLSLWISARNSFFQLTNSSTFVTTNFGDKARIFLPDSTEVILNSGSKIQYDGVYNQKQRIVKLNGEAFFNVKTNPKKPFVVKLDKLIVSATGTKFNVLSYDNENRVEATLEEGELQVSLEGGKIIDLKQGQQVVYSKLSNSVEVQDVEAETYTAWMENKLRLDDTPLEEALRKIARKYNVTFEVASKELLDLRYTATFIDETLEEVMDMLKVISPIKYKIYYRATINDKQYLKPKIVIGRKRSK